MLSKLNNLLNRRDKLILFNLILFSIFISFLETIGISAIMPFVSIATNFNLIDSNSYYRFFYNYFNFSGKIEFIVVFGIILIFFYIFRSLLNLFYFFVLNKFIYGRYHIIAYKLFENYMGLSYQNFLRRNSSNLTKSIVNEANHLTSLLYSGLLIITEFFVMIFIYIMMLYIDYKITFFLTIILLLNAFLMLKTVSKTIKKAGVLRESIQKKFYEIINRSFGNFKLIKLNTNDDQMLHEFNNASMIYAKSNITNQTLAQVPRLFLEAIAFSLIILIISYLIYDANQNISSALATLSMFVLALYRLMPSVNRIMTNYNQIVFLHKSLDVIHHDLMYETENLGTDKINFLNHICINDISYAYEKGYPILTSVSLTIKKGEKIAFIGESGSGKSTLIDILIGLHRPSSGRILIDNIELTNKNIKSWRQKIGYIPQSVYLFDGSVAENVIFGRDYNEERLIVALKQANIYDYLQTQNGIHTLVGEGGVMLSGGQKQRIAIARALYGDPEILVLDEATSALDHETEEKIMQEIYALSDNKTLVIIAHRLSTLSQCEKTYHLDKGILTSV